MGIKDLLCTVAATAVTTLLLCPASSAMSRNAKEVITTKVKLIVTADYKGDRAALRRLYDELGPYSTDTKLGSRVRYWRGFALWRRAINGFNDQAEASDLEKDLQTAQAEFDRSSELDPHFVESQIGSLSCLGMFSYSVGTRDRSQAKILVPQILEKRRQVEAIAAGNPRLLWVVGPMVWNLPPERGGGQDRAIELYEQGLKTIRSAKASADPLEPTWGEPELLMSLAWSNLHKSTPQLDAAEQDAAAALRLVPYWHYVRDILLPQIREAKKGQTAALHCSR